MGYATIIFTCVACNHLSQAHPILVPSLRVSWDVPSRQYVADPNGRREPICRSCAEKVGDRARRGEVAADPSTITPEYLDRAYNTGTDEHDL